MFLRSGRRLGQAAVAGSLLLALALAASACLGGGDGDLLDQASPTPFFQASPQATSSPGPTGTPSATPSADVTPVTPFEITVSSENSGLRIRERPEATEDTPIVGQIFVREPAKVTGEAQGQEAVEGQGTLWYFVEIMREGNLIRGFVYAPLTEKVEE
ncbi:MAG: hypothetical protein ACE5KW_06095 [Dehalococcoidia bacterium]